MNTVMMRALLSAYNRIQTPLVAAQMREHAYRVEQRLVAEENRQRYLNKFARQHGGPKTITELEFMQMQIAPSHPYRSPRGRSSSMKSMVR